MSKTKVTVKIKGGIGQVKKALAHLAGTTPVPQVPLREADFRDKNKVKK